MDGGKAPANAAGGEATSPAFELRSVWTLGFERTKETGDCFLEECWGLRDRDVGRLLPKMQSHRVHDTVSVYQALHSRMTFRHMAAAVLSVPTTTPLGVLAHTLIMRRRTVPLCAVEHLVAQQEQGVDIGLQALNRGNFMFAEAEGGRVCVLNLMRDMGEWHVHLFPFELEYGWGKPDRLLVLNMAAKILRC